MGLAAPRNRLADETSAYLRQHRHNPVAWWPWGSEPFEEAARRDCPVLVSIGYASCHWCHVMERESFESEAIAELMNRELVCIKVDREERPDVDQIYMDAVVGLTGRGGWPLNVFCLPDGRPFFGGTYFPPQRAHGRPGWPDVVQAIGQLYRRDGARVVQQAEQIVAALDREHGLGAGEPPGIDALRELERRLLEQADAHHGGFGSPPKFPMPPCLEALLLARSLGAGSHEVWTHLCFTLVCMSRGGLFDQLGGGFHRYSTDAEWRVPHFEKMLYDQGQLLRVYSEAFRQTRDPRLAWPVEETIAYLEREMRSPAGGFFASQDADSEGEEGRFYVWSPDEIERALGAEAAGPFCEIYGVVPGGSFEATGKSVLHDLGSQDRARFASERAVLLRERARRTPPDTDSKHVASWIGYTIGGIATAAAAWHRDDWRALAEGAADFVWRHLGEREGELLRIWDGEGARVPAFLDDHAALLQAHLDLLRAGGTAHHARAALALAARICDAFYDQASSELYFARSGDPTLIYRPRTDSDGATPSAAGLAVLGLVRAAALSGRARLADVARAVLRRHAPLLARTPHALPTLARAGALDAAGVGLGLVVGDPSAPESRALARRARELLHADELVVAVRPGERPDWLDGAWLEGRADASVPTAWICRTRTCSLPATHPDDLHLP